MGQNPATTTIDLYAGLRRLDPAAGRAVVVGRYQGLIDVGPSKIKRGKFAIEFRAPDVAFRADERQIAKAVADAITETVRGNLLHGRDPTGNPLPTSDEDTIKRRDYRRAQSARDGSLDERITDKDQRRKGRKNFLRRFYTARVLNPNGDVRFRPVASRVFGFESGLLAASAKAAAEPDGSWRVFFANVRAIADRKSGGSAVQRVFGRIPFWNQAAMRQPRIQEALRQVRDGLMASRRAQAIAEMVKTIRLTRAIAEEAEAVATAEAADE